MSVVVGIVIVALICWIIAVFGMTPFHVYERYRNPPLRIAIFSSGIKPTEEVSTL